MRCIGNKKKKKAEACNWSLKPSQMAPDQDGTVMCQRSHVFWEVGNPASATPSRQVEKAGASIEINVQTAFPDPQTEFSLLVQCRPECQALRRILLLLAVPSATQRNCPREHA